MPIEPRKLAFRVIEVLMEDLSIGLTGIALLAISGCDAAFLARANSVISCAEPLVGMFVESRDEGRFFSSFLERKFVAPYDESKYEII